MKKVLILLVLTLSLFLSGCNIFEKRNRKVEETYENLAKEVEYDTAFITNKEIVLNSKPYNYMEESIKFLKENKYKIGKVAKSDYDQIGDILFYKNFIYYTIRYDAKRSKYDQGKFDSYQYKIALMRMDYSIRKIEILKVFDYYAFESYDGPSLSAPSVLKQLDDEYFIIKNNYTIELYAFRNFKLIQTFTLNDDIMDYTDDVGNGKFGIIHYFRNKYFTDIYYIRENILKYYEYKNGTYILHTIIHPCLENVKSSYMFKRLDNKVLLENILAFDLESDCFLDLEKVTEEIYKHEYPIPEKNDIFVVQNIKFRIIKLDTDEIKLIREDESTDLINLELLKQNKTYLQIAELLNNGRSCKIDTDRFDYYVFDNRLFIQTVYQAAYSGLWNRKSFMFEYDFNDKKLNYLGCIPRYSLILNIDVLN